MASKRKHTGVIASVAALVAVAALTFGIVTISSNAFAAQEGAASQQASELEQQVSDLESKLKAETEKSMSTATSIDLDRVSDDEQKISDIMTNATTWSDGKSYEASRQAIIDAGVSEDSEFLTGADANDDGQADGFMPPVVYYTGTDGDSRSTIDDTGASTKCSDVKVYCQGAAEDGTYEYLAVATADSTSGSATVSTTYVMTCSMDANGNISDAWAIQLS